MTTMVDAKAMSKIATEEWAEEITHALKQLGGAGRYIEIYPIVKARGRTWLPTDKSSQGGIRQAVQVNCPSYPKYRGTHLFDLLPDGRVALANARAAPDSAEQPHDAQDGEFEDELRAQHAALENDGAFDPESLEDARRIEARAVAIRQGQSSFRTALLAAYGGKCAVTGCDAEAALEAAHVLPYRGPAWNDVRNGLILRSDIHTLFDRELLSIDPDGTISLAAQLTSTSYSALAGVTARLPSRDSVSPRTALAARKKESGEA